MRNIIQKIIKLRQSIYRRAIISLRASNKSKGYFQISFLRGLPCLTSDRTVIGLILIDLLSSEHSKTSFRHDSFPQLIGISIDSEWSECVREVGHFLSISSFSPSTRNFDECRAVEMCWRSRKCLSDMKSFPSARCSMASVGLETRTEHYNFDHSTRRTHR